MDFNDEFFGSAPQITVSRRARDVWRLIADDPRFSYNGRIVTVAGFIGDDTAEKLMALARLQGASTCHFLPKDKSKAILQEVEGQGFSSNIWEFCQGGETAYQAARSILETHQLPADITVTQLNTDTDPALIRDFATTVGESGVLVMAGPVMRGLGVPGVTLAGIDQSGKVVASAWGYKCYHPQGRFSDYAFWGGLSCRPERRGQKIALVMGALSIVQLWETLGIRNFCTGIAEDNVASFSICEKLGVSVSNEIGLGVTDPDMFRGASLTK